MAAHPDPTPTEIAPCPFCGGDARMSDLTDEDERRYWTRSITCDVCEATIKAGIPWSQYHALGPVGAATLVSTLVKAKWNARTPAPFLGVINPGFVPREFLLLTSYCGSPPDMHGCTPSHPCSECLDLCNVFDEHGNYLRMFGNPPAAPETPSKENLT